MSRWWIGLWAALAVAGCSSQGGGAKPPDGGAPLTTSDGGSGAPTGNARPSPIAEENQLAGDPGWHLGAPSKGLWGFSDRVSYLPGDTVEIHAAATSAASGSWQLWRLGYYDGAGGRELASGDGVTISEAAPAVMDPVTGAVRAPWPVAFRFSIPHEAPTGVYLVKLITRDHQSYVPLVVREPTPSAPILAMISFNTYQAYNAWGGTGLYDNTRSDWPYKHAFAASFDRPYAQGDGAGQLFVADRDFVTFAEGQGYDVDYVADADIDADPALTRGRRMIVIEGHAEYWTSAMRDRIDTALDAGTNLAFFGANDGYWQVRYQPSESGVPRRLLVGYKEYADQDPDTAPDELTAQFRDPRIGRPENALVGIMFGDWQWTDTPFSIDDPAHWLWTGAKAQAGALVPGLFGFEVDHRYPNGAEPAGLVEIGSALGENHDGVLAPALSSLYTAKSGALVFAAGSVTWSRVLAEPGAWDRRIQQATANLFSRMAGGGALGAGLLAPLSLGPAAPSPEYQPGATVSTVTTALSRPVAIAAAPNGDAIVVDGDRLVRVDAAGRVSPIAGGAAGFADGPGAGAQFDGPRGLAVAPDGTIYVADTGNERIRRVSPAGVVDTIAGGKAGFADGPGASARFDGPMSLARTSSGTLLVADGWNNRIRAVAPDGSVSTWAGDGTREVQSGPGASARFYFPFAITLLADGSAVVAESDTGVVAQIANDAAHTVSIYAGEVGRTGWQDGPLATASLSETIGLCGWRGGLALLDGATYRVRQLASGELVTLAGGATAALVDGPGASAGFRLPRAVAAAPDGSLLIVDTGNHALRRMVAP